jgi:hypothetical protein
MLSEDYVTTRKNQKTYGRFFGTILLPQIQSMQITGDQRIARRGTTQKRKKTTAKLIFSRAHPRFFCQNGQKPGRFCCQYVFLVKVEQTILSAQA